MQPNCSAYKKKEEKSNFVIFTLRCIGILAVLLIVFSFINLNKQGTLCLSQPFIYGANKLKEQFSGDVYCSCQIRGEDGSFKTYSFDQFQENPNPFPYLNVINNQST